MSNDVVTYLVYTSFIQAGLNTQLTLGHTLITPESGTPSLSICFPISLFVDAAV